MDRFTALGGAPKDPRVWEALADVADWLGFVSCSSDEATGLYNDALDDLNAEIWDDDKRGQWQKEHK